MASKQKELEIEEGKLGELRKLKRGVEKDIEAASKKL